MEVKGTPLSRVRKKNQVTIPKEIREHLDLEIGDYVIFYMDCYNKVIVSKAKVLVLEA